MNTIQTSYASQFTPEQSSSSNEDKTEATENNNSDTIKSIWTKDRFNEKKIAKHELSLNVQNSQMSWRSQVNNNLEEIDEPMEDVDDEDMEKEEDNKEVAMVTSPIVENEQNSPAHHARRPMNAFLIFCKKHRPIVRKKYPNYENRSVTKILGEWWALLEDDDKKPYVDLAKEHKDAFFTANPNFKWYKLPAPPLRTLTTRPGSVQKEPLLPQSPTLLSSHHESEFTPGKLADESQLGNLTSLMQTTYAKVTETDEKTKLTDYTMNNNNNDEINDKLLESPPTVIREVMMPSKPIKKRKLGENVENRAIARDIFESRKEEDNGKITNRELMDKVVDNMFITKNYVPQNGRENISREPRKSERSCKGLKYIEFMANGKLIKNKREKQEISIKSEDKSEAKVEYLQNTINKLAERTNRTNIRELIPETKRVYTNSESSEENFPKSDFNLDRRISDLPTLEYDTYMQRKRESKKRKLPKTKPKVQNMASSNNNNNNSHLIGSQKRKNKRSITHLETRDAPRDPTDLSGLATLAEIAANSQKIN